MAQDQNRSADSTRLLTLDIVRGYAMLAMLLSHTSWWLADLEYRVAYGWDNMIVPSLGTLESLIGLILQFATPAFFLLSGFSIALFAAGRARQGWTEWQITRFLLIRGLLLIVLDLTVMNLEFEPPYYVERLSVLTGIGICVCLFSVLRLLPLRAIAAIGALVLLAVQLWYYEHTLAGTWPAEASLLRSALLAPSVEDMTWRAQFPALPWLPVVALGFIIGKRVVTGSIRLERKAVSLGVSFVVLGMVVTLTGGFGNLYPNHPLIFGKHPPDLAYLLIYIGITFLLIAFHSRFNLSNTPFLLRAVAAMGQTALFFYIVHVRLIYVFSLLIAPLELPSLERSLLIALAALPLLVALCMKYRAYKRAHPDSLLRYL